MKIDTVKNNECQINYIFNENLFQEKRIIIDLSSILLEDKNIDGKAKLKNFKRIIEVLELNGYNKLIFIADASLKYKIDNKNEYEKLLMEKKIIQAPAGKKADLFILKCAKRWDCDILFNDLFRDHRNKYRKNWINSKRKTLIFIENEIFLE